jgi:hypothetical protein
MSGDNGGQVPVSGREDEPQGVADGVPPLPGDRVGRRDGRPRRLQRFALTVLAIVIIAAIVLGAVTVVRHHPFGKAASASPGQGAPAGYTISATNAFPAGEMTVWVNYAYRGDDVVVRGIRASFRVTRGAGYALPVFGFVFQRRHGGHVDAKITSPVDQRNNAASYATDWLRIPGPRSRRTFRGGERLTVTLRAGSTQTGRDYRAIVVGLVLTPKVRPPTR